MSQHNDYHPNYLKGIEYFNECDFFEAHEVWEELWSEEQGPSRLFYKGLIQAAVCLHHFGNGNLRGTTKLYHGCRKYLEAYLPKHLGLDLEQLLSEMETCCAEVLACQDQASRIEIDPELMPEIHLEPPPQPRD